MLDGGQVLVLQSNGIVEAIVPASEAGDGVEVLEGILCPGFINAHCHIELSHLKNKIVERTGLVDFVQQVMTGREATAVVKNAAMEAAVEELYNSGTVAVGDICNTADSVQLKQGSKMRWRNFIEVSGFVDAVATKRMEAVEAIASQFPGSVVTPHSPYSVSKTLFRLLNERTRNAIISIHNQEAAAENELYENKQGAFLELYKNLGIDISAFAATGKTSLQTWLPYFDQQQSIIAVHNSFTSKADMDFADQYAAARLYYCICINANLYIEDHLPPVELLLQQNQTIVMGTDSYASNWQLDMMAEIKTIQKHFPAIPLSSILQWATLNGARALGMDDQLGSFEKGKQPGVVVIDEGNMRARRLL